jgi:hypothetical protein
MSLPFSDFHQLRITEAFNPEKVWKSISVIIVSIGEHLNLLALPARPQAQLELIQHLTAGLLGPLSHCEGHKKV